MAPVSWNGANTLYHKVIKPFVLKHQSQIDEALDKVGEKVDEVAKDGTKYTKCLNVIEMHGVCTEIKPS